MTGSPVFLDRFRTCLSQPDRHVPGLHIVPQGFAAFVTTVAGFAVATERGFDAAGIPFVNENLVPGTPD